jgi:ADP-heptose:LPS heptosyltransferase
VTGSRQVNQPDESAPASAEARLKEFRGLREHSALCTAVTEQLATEAASRFLEEYRVSGTYLTDAITLLAEIATLEEPCLSEPGQRATFPLLVERLSDSFDPEQCPLYDRVFAQMFSHCRALPAAARVDAALRSFGFNAEKEFLDRKARLRQRPPWRETDEQRGVRKALLLSRVTLGADVAVTSVALQKASHLFPQAERVLLAPPKARELFGGDTSLRIREVGYASAGTLIERLESWLGVVTAVEDELRGVSEREFVLIDPDSRYLQLGMLPALRDESRYFFFESRRAGSGESKSLSRLTLDWLNETFGGNEPLLPRVWLREPDRQFGDRVVQRLRAGGAQWITALSFGVGGNQEKRIPDPFEQELVARLLEEGSTIVLDQGAGEEERERAHRIVELVSASGGSVAALDAAHAEKALADHSPLRCQVLTWQGGIGAWSGLIAASDAYIGYDSAGQHIAAALGITTIDIFSASAKPIFRERWRPSGPGIVRVLAERERNSTGDSNRTVLEEVLQAYRKIRKK